MKININKRLLPIFLILLFSCSDIMKEHYSSYEEVVKDNAIERGWIPKFLPKSSYDIYEKHDIDNNRVWLTFKFKQHDQSSLLDSLKIPEKSELVPIKKLLHANFSLNNKDISFYKYSKIEVVALDLNDTKCYYYSAGSFEIDLK